VCQPAVAALVEHPPGWGSDIRGLVEEGPVASDDSPEAELLPGPPKDDDELREGFGKVSSLKYFTDLEDHMRLLIYKAQPCLICQRKF